MWDRDVYGHLEARKAAALEGGGTARIAKQHAAGKLTARERIEILFDSDTFVEVGGLMEVRSHSEKQEDKKVPGDGVVTGYGKINGRLAFVSSEDFTVAGGTLGEVHAQKICQIQDMALNALAPIIMIHDGGGARIDEGIDSLSGYAGIFLRNTKASGIIPQIAVILGPCAGGACYSPAICDFIFMSEKTSCMFITGPKVLKTVTYETVTKEDLGGADVHGTKSGVAHVVCADDRACLEDIRRLLGYLPQSSRGPLLVGRTRYTGKGTVLEELVPQNAKKGYDVRSVIGAIADEDSFFEIHSGWAKNAVVGLARIEGNSVGFVANQPSCMAGSIDCDASDKMARFIRMCDSFGIPLVTLVDTAAFLPGIAQEHNGIIRHGAKLLYAYSEATVPKISLIMRKAYGGAYIAMNSKRMGADIVFAWPIAELAVMGAEGAVAVLKRHEIEENPNCRNELVREYEEKYLNPYIAAERGYVDEIIAPEDTRARIVATIEMLKDKLGTMSWKKHGNIPL